MWGWIMGLGALWVLFILALFILPIVFWILKVVRLSKNEDKSGMWVVLACGFFFTPLIGLIVGLFFKEDDATKNQEEKYFWCGICDIKYKEEFLGGESAREGKICRSCLREKHKGESLNRSEEINKGFNQRPQQPEKTNWDYQKFSGRKDEERRILLRKLSHKQGKKSRHLTQFIINLFILQWLSPLITIIFFWYTIKEQMKVNAMNNPKLGLSTELPFKTITKDIYKILTSEFYDFGRHKISISFAWKIGIILAILIPLIFWIYNLIKFLGTSGEVEQLQTELKK
jgi:hypothetical protein